MHAHRLVNAIAEQRENELKTMNRPQRNERCNQMLQHMYNGSTKGREKGAEKYARVSHGWNPTNSLKTITYISSRESLQNPVSSKHKEVHKQIS